MTAQGKHLPGPPLDGKIWMLAHIEGECMTIRVGQLIVTIRVPDVRQIIDDDPANTHAEMEKLAGRLNAYAQSAQITYRDRGHLVDLDFEKEMESFVRRHLFLTRRYWRCHALCRRAAATNSDPRKGRRLDALWRVLYSRRAQLQADTFRARSTLHLKAYPLEAVEHGPFGFRRRLEEDEPVKANAGEDKQSWIDLAVVQLRSTYAMLTRSGARDRPAKG
ncbi:hypothetical protein [Agrobacterium tumefaciens]|uniref:hypothetical protein n=1 Tax=Agrobacterium tumefaciens TaxID=358 RepID=UPI001574CC3E|nr:hypothetical protein [Agrobacterium tumefaciens]NTE37679.1 hypothetical protein [Agrobacterium tumefaciens]NTE53142.1 hypothetical protein [Agrobacterium tumefaciens]